MENKKTSKNDWGDLFTNVTNKVLVIKDKSGKVVFELDLVLAFILALFVNVLALIFILLVLMGNWTFETRMKDEKKAG